MVDISSRRVIDIIETRETGPVKDWLKTFPSLRYVSRDGSTAYKSAITQADENIVQISDRFHLLKGLTDAAKKHITSCFKANIGLPALNLDSGGIKTGPYWIKDTGNTDIRARQHACNTKRKMKLAEEAKRLKKEGRASAEIAGIIGVGYITALKYLKPDFNPGYSGYNAKHRGGKLAPYAEDVKLLLSKGLAFKEIEGAICFTNL